MVNETIFWDGPRASFGWAYKRGGRGLLSGWAYKRNKKNVSERRNRERIKAKIPLHFELHL